MTNRHPVLAAGLLLYTVCVVIRALGRWVLRHRNTAAGLLLAACLLTTH